MKTTKRIGNCLTMSTIILAVAAMAWLPNSAQAQGGAATQLKKFQTAEDIQQIEVGDTFVMSCPKCKETYMQVVEKSYHAATPDQLKTMNIDLCSGCDTRLVTKGTIKQPQNVLVHTYKVCGSEDVTCCFMKKGSGPTPGMK